jgi:hypothetical protein
VVWSGGSVATHYAFHGVVNGWQVALAFFLAVKLTADDAPSQ